MHHVTAERVGVRIFELRHKRGLSQSDLEALSGVPKARLSRYEHGHVTPTLQTLDKIAAALGYTLAELLRGIT